MCELSGRRPHNGGVRILVVDDQLQDEDAQAIFKARLTSLPSGAYRNLGEEGFRSMVSNRVVEAGFAVSNWSLRLMATKHLLVIANKAPTILC